MAKTEIDKLTDQIIKLEDKLWALKLKRSNLKMRTLIKGCPNTR
jgi:hypothetical protein